MKREYTMNKNVLEFYVLANKLKEAVRTGWLEVEISNDRVESVAEHIYGSVILAIALVVNIIQKVLESLSSKDELISLLDEYYFGESREAKFVKQLSKIESDIQAKIYDNNGYFDLDKAKEDAKYYGEELSSEIIPQMKNASDGWIMYDRRYYTDDMFKSLSDDIQKMRQC